MAHPVAGQEGLQMCAAVQGLGQGVPHGEHAQFGVSEESAAQIVHATLSLEYDCSE